MRIEPLPYDPRLAFSLPAWVIENIQAVSAYMKTRGYDEWTIAGVRSQAAHASDVTALHHDLTAYMQIANAESAARIEAEARAEAAENAMRTIASTHEGRMAIAKAIHTELDKVDEWLDEAVSATRKPISW